ncbi:MAG TPA: NAD-dependent epimerase/dehydratase family protein [Bryobacteraceae bacterium]|nr:NAD-dependent epimerase/dehydratase family protein [Bryobacteraceae bacterium]
MTRAIFGATGSVGKALAAEWAAARLPFRVVGRSEERLRRDFARYGDLVEYRVADFAHERQTRAAAHGADIIVYLGGVPYTQFHLHPQLTRVALEAAIAEGVGRFVLQGTVYPFGLPQTPTVNEEHPRNPNTAKGRWRKEQEDLVMAAHGRGLLRTAVVRAPDFYGPGAELSYASDMFKAALEGRRAQVIGPIDIPHEFIYVPDLARTLAELSEKDEAYGASWNVAGPGMITVRHFAELVFGAVGRKPALRVAGKTMLRLAGIFNPFLREVAEMHYLWTNPVQLDDTRLRALLPGLHKTSYEDGIRATVEAMRA